VKKNLVVGTLSKCYYDCRSKMMSLAGHALRVVLVINATFVWIPKCTGEDN
jgi:hypothetical protein